MSRQSARQREYMRRRRIYRFFLGITYLVLISAALVTGFAVGLFAAVAKVLPPGETLGDISPSVPTRILAADGSLLAKVLYAQEDREVVPLTRMGHIKSATLAIEDIRFFEHPGVDPRGIVRATMKNVRAGDSKEGASTITQQLARNLYLSRKKEMTRKLQEIILALQLERRYSKEEILEVYLNQIYYGANLYGVQSYGVQMAARNFFGKNVDDLTLAEAALLAGLPKNPKGYSPFRNHEAAKRRRAVVLHNMLVYNLINRAQYEEARDAPIKLAPQNKPTETADWHAPYFVRYVLNRELPRLFGQDTAQLVYHYGLVVHTSLDPRMQKVAEHAVATQVAANRARRIQDGALVAIDPKTGFVKALVGGTDFRGGQYDVITQGRRQPGSAFKPFVYTAALLRGYTPDTIVHDTPVRYPTGTGQFWSPKNADGGFRGPMSLRRALEISRNVPAASTAYDIGITYINDIAYRMGIKHKLENYLSTSLGSSVVVPLEICSAYGTLANGGVYNPPTCIRQVTTRDGGILYDYATNRPRPRRALPTRVADTMQDILRGAIERGTGTRARCPFPASGKTGTTNSYRDAWFIGFTDDLVAAVWVGNRDNREMNRTFGGTVPAPIWRDFMLVAQPIMAAEHEENAEELARMNSLPETTDIDTTPTAYVLKQQGRTAPPQPGEEPAPEEPAPRDAGAAYHVSICSGSGKQATPYCPETVVVVYYKGRLPAPPEGRCTIHTAPASIPPADNQGNGSTASSGRGVVISICAETGKIASDKCPLVQRRRFTSNAPTETCPLHGQE